MRGFSGRMSAGLAALVLALGCVPLNAAQAADPEDREPHWTTSAPAPVSPRSNAEAVPLSPETVLVFDGRAGAGGMVAMTPVGATSTARDAAIVNMRTGAWTLAAPMPSGIEVRKAVDSDGFAYAPTMKRDGFVRYDAAANRWDTVPSPPIRYVSQYVVAGGRLVALDLGPIWPGKSPAGVVLDAAGRWHELPPLPPRTYGSNGAAWTHALWTGEQLVISSEQVGGKIRLAALPLDGEDGWKRLPSARSDIQGAYWLDPVVVAGRIVWRDVVYDLATGRSDPLPERVSTALARSINSGRYASPPNGLIFGERVTLAGWAFDPITGTTMALPQAPTLGNPGSTAFAGGPSGILAFGGAVSAGLVNTSSNLFARLLPAGAE